MSVGKRTSLFAIDNMFYLVYECASVLLITMITRMAYVWSGFLLPLLLVIQSVLGIFIVAVEMPFFRTFANCFSIGWSTARLFASIVNLVTVFANSENQDTMGIIFSSVTLGIMIIGFVVGFGASFLYTRYIIWKAVSVQNALKNNQLPKVNSSYLVIACRLCCTNETKRADYERSLAQLSQTKYESASIYIMLATVVMFFRKEAIGSAMIHLRKALSLRPNVAKRFMVFLRSADVDRLRGDESDNRKLYKILHKVKKHNARSIFFAKQFWKESLDNKNMNVSKMSDLAMQLENSVTCA